MPLPRQKFRRLLAALPALVVMLALAGCETTAPTPATDGDGRAKTQTTMGPATPAPAPAVESPPGSILGFEETSALLDNFTVYVAAIDGVPVPAGREGWKTPLSLPAGNRRLTLVFNRGVFTAQADVPVAVASGASYEARFATDAQLFGRNSYCEFWVVDAATGQPVTSRVRSTLNRTEAAK